jgi:hypothetical protein
MAQENEPRRVTIRLTPYQARKLWKLRTHGLPGGARPRTVTEVLVGALLKASSTVDGVAGVADEGEQHVGGGAAPVHGTSGGIEHQKQTAPQTN